jgi:hypothetical protein
MSIRSPGGKSHTAGSHAGRVHWHCLPRHETGNTRPALTVVHHSFAAVLAVYDLQLCLWLSSLKIISSRVLVKPYVPLKSQLRCNVSGQPCLKKGLFCRIKGARAAITAPTLTMSSSTGYTLPGDQPYQGPSSLVCDKTFVV